MALFSIKSANGQTTRYEGKLRYNGIFGGVSYVEFQQIASPTLIDFHVGDYVDYSRTGFRYKLYSVPKPTKKSGNDTVGDTYVYKNVQLHCATRDLELAPFRDLVLNDNLIHFTTLPTISVYDDVYGIADRIQACMDDFAGTGIWNIRVTDTSDPAVLSVLQQEKEYSVSGVSCLEALNEIYKLWSGIGWIYSTVNGVNTITIGRPNVQDAGNTTDVFSYGLGNGLTVIAQAVSTKTEMATRLYAYGSDRNMQPRYYNNIRPAIFSSESVYIPNLMLPLSSWGATQGQKDARKAYVEDVAAQSEYGLIPKTIYFDGSGNYEEIYPSLEGMTFAELRASLGPGAEYYPSTSRYPNSDYVNTIKAVSNPTDNGVLENAGQRYLESGTDAFAAVEQSYPYVAGQYVLNINPGGVLATYTAAHTGRMKIDFPSSYTVEGADLLEATANVVVTVNGTARQIVPIEVTRMRMEAYFETPSITVDVEAGDVIGLVLGIEARLSEGNSGGFCYVEGTEGVASFNLQYTIGDYFTLTLKQIGFDISKQGTPLTNGLATISMKSGMCGGREFVVKSCKYDELQDEWLLQCYRQKDDSLGQYFPNSSYPIAEGDSYVLIDMMMPDVYVGAAEQRLLERAQEVLAYMSKPKIIYTPEIDAKVLALTPETLLEGMYMPVYDENLIPTETPAYPHVTWVLISSLVIAEDESAIPTYKVTLMDEKPESFLQSYTHEMNSNATRLRLEAIEEARGPYIPDGEVTGAMASSFVEITASADYFIYPAGASAPTVSEITLQAIPYDIANPTYQWYWLGTQGWEPLSGETGQAYVVDPNSSIYYQNGELAEDFRCVVTSGGASYEAQRTIVKLTGGENGLTVMLNNPAHIFSAGTTAAVAGSDTVSVIAFKGTTRAVTSVGTIGGTVTGLTASVSDNNTDHTSITISVTTHLTRGSGVLTIPVTVAGQTVTLTYSWALGFKGEPGSTGQTGYGTITLLLYKRSASQPGENEMPGSVTYTFGSDSITTPANGWTRTPPTADGNPLWMVQGSGASRGNTVTISTWNGPIRFVLDGTPGATGKIMRGPTIYDPSFPYQGLDGDGPYLDYVYNVVNGQPDYTKMYYAKKDSTGVQPPNGTYWEQTTVQEFVATKVFYASLGYVDNLGVRIVKIEDSGTIYGGFMPPQTAYAQGKNNGDYIFWAGGDSPANAVASIDKNGFFRASAGIFSGFLQIPFVKITDGCSYSSSGRYYTVGDKCNLISAGNEVATGYVIDLRLPISLDEVGKVVTIFDFPVKTQSSYSITVRTQLSGRLLIPTVASTYGLGPQTWINTGKGGMIQFVAVRSGNDVYWFVLVNSTNGGGYGY